MVGRAKTQRQQNKEAADFKDTWMQRAIYIYHQEQRLPKPRSQTKICQQAEAECFQMTKKVVKLSSSTLDRRVKGGQSHKEYHKGQRWLNDEENEAVLLDITLNAQRGFPLTHRRIKEHVDEIARARHGNAFPVTGVGKKWTHRFVSDNKDRISAYWSKPLDHARARAVNPATKVHYFKMLREVMEGDGKDDVIPPELQYGVDESGFQKGVGQKERVFGASGQKIQHQRRSGDRENITVIVTICGDGTSTAPAVIFKGEGFQARWKQNNPLNAS
jgi:Tc5 transposase DNA-binding domain